MIIGESEGKGRYASVGLLEIIGNQLTGWGQTSEMQSKTLVLVSLGWWVSKLFGWFFNTSFGEDSNQIESSLTGCHSAGKALSSRSPGVHSVAVIARSGPCLSPGTSKMLLLLGG